MLRAVKKNARQLVGVLLLIGWLASAFGLLWQERADYIGWFATPAQLSQLAQAAVPVAFANGQHLVMVVAPNCQCRASALRHRDWLQAQTGLRLHTWSLEQADAAGIALPATPALLWWQHGKLWYAGPLATGATCTAEQDLLRPLLMGERALPAPWFNAETVACRCLNGAVKTANL